jgi:hypothetical protein
MLGFDAPLEDIEITDAAPAEQNSVLNADFPISQKFDFLFYTLSSLVVLMVIGSVFLPQSRRFKSDPNRCDGYHPVAFH